MVSIELFEKVVQFLSNFIEPFGHPKVEYPIILDSQNLEASVPELTTLDTTTRALLVDSAARNVFSEFGLSEFITDIDLHPFAVIPLTTSMEKIDPSLIGQYVRTRGIVGDVAETRKVFTMITYRCFRCGNMRLSREHPPSQCPICYARGNYEVIPEMTRGYKYQEAELKPLDDEKRPSLYNMKRPVHGCETCGSEFIPDTSYMRGCPNCRALDTRIITSKSTFVEIPNSPTSPILILLGPKCNSLSGGEQVEVVGRVEYHRLRKNDPTNYQLFIIVAYLNSDGDSKEGNVSTIRDSVLHSRLKKHIRMSKVPVIGYTAQKLKSKLLELVEL